jgi:hypothetical protein
MSWTIAANIKGPQGDQGPPGDDGAPGAPGADGTSVEIAGSVANAAALPGGLTAGDAGTGYIAQDTGHLHVWDGAEWDDVGNIKGPQGDPGDAGAMGPRGSKWFVGAGAPGTLTGQAAGDFYLDSTDGTVYELS